MISDWTVQTWEQAATMAAKELWNRYEPLSAGLDALVVTSKAFNVIANDAFGEDNLHETWLADRFANLGARALWGQPIATLDVWSKLLDVRDLIARKQHDYGHGNIERFGIDGIIVRLSDKLARLENLTKRGAGTPGDLEKVLTLNEPLADTWDDIIGYSIIAVMLVQGTFHLPLAADRIAAEGQVQQ